MNTNNQIDPDLEIWEMEKFWKNLYLSEAELPDEDDENLKDLSDLPEPF